MQYLIDNNIKEKGEFQFTTALENMKRKGATFVPGEVEEWLDCECVWIPVPGSAHRSILAGLLASLAGGSKLIPDAHLAVLAIEHGLAVCSSDGDYARFKSLRWINPLAP